MGSNRGTSIYNAKNHIESLPFRKDKEEKSLQERKEKVMPKVKEQFENFELVEPVIKEAERLLDIYGSSNDIPVEEFDNSDFDDARLLAFCELIKESRNRTLQ